MAAEQEESLQRIERGGITVAAEQRLRELREHGGLFTTDLSVDGWAISHQLGLRPLSQVMGSSIYQMGYQSSWGQVEGGYDPFGTYMFELDTLSQALNEVRSRALGRLAEEATHVGADAVVEVRTRAGESSFDTGTVTLEHTVFGTAVSYGGAPSQGGGRHEGRRPVLTELSAADFSKLARAGFRPLGIVAWSSVFFAGYSASGLGVGGRLSVGITENYEQRDFTKAFYDARETAMAELNAQASALGAAGVVGMRIGHRAVPHTLQGGIGRGGMSSSSREGLMVTFNAIGTAIAQTEQATLYPPETAIDLTT
jgi:uncharacterized protein YbjQ (UPF0145 family)